MAAKGTRKPRSEKKLKLGIIGAGMYAAAAHVPAIRRLSSVEITSVCRKHKERLKKFQETYNIPRGYTDYKEMLKKEKLDGVIIASPNAFHYEHAMACLRKNIPILIEKPMCLKSAEGFKLYTYANQHNIPVVVGFNRHYWANFCYAKKLIEEQQLGTITFITVRWIADIEWALERSEPPESFQQKAFYEIGDEPNFRGDPNLAGGGMFIDGGSHMLDAVFWLTNLKPLEIFALIETRGYQTDCDSSVSIRFDNNALCSCTVMGASRSLKGHEIYIYGSKGSLYVDDFTIFYQFNGQKEVQVVDLPADSCSTANFVHVLQNKEKITCGIDDGLKAVIGVESAYKSAEEHKPARIEKWVK